MQDPREPRTPEIKAVLLVLGLLALQECHEIVAFIFQQGSFRAGLLAVLSLVLLPWTLWIIVQLLRGNRAAGNWALWVFGVAGVLFLSAFGPPVWKSLPWNRPIMPNAFESEYEWIGPSTLMKPFETFWILAKITLTLAVPLLLIVDRIRMKLRKTEAARIREPQ